jgi:vanillate O-demethylase ferredoxin subunit
MSIKKLTVRVNSVREEANDIVSFELVCPEGGNLPPAAPGAHIDVHVAPGLVRQYSVCNGPGAQDHYLIAVKREPGSRGGSAGMHEKVKAGDLLTISEPRNNFSLKEGAPHYTLVAGGIGVTPILSMAKHLVLKGANFRLLYFTRSIKHTAFHSELSSPEYDSRVHFNYALTPEATGAYLRQAFSERPGGDHMYICGPKPFMDLVVESASEHWPADAVHLEYFTANLNPLTEPSEEFKVILKRSGNTYVIPEGKSIVEVLKENDIEIEVSCEQGICGTCLTGVLEGVPVHHDMYLTDEEKAAGDKMTPCVSRGDAGMTLVLDL